MITWGELRAMLRRTFLMDTTPDEETGEFRHTDAKLLDCVKLALDRLCVHTAVATATAYPAAGTAYPLPDNTYTGDQIWPSLLVWVEDSVGKPVYLNPAQISESVTGDYQILGHELRLLVVPPAGATLHIEYYAHYDYPIGDASVINVPHWAITAVAYCTSAYALSGFSLRSSSIRQWNTRSDSGNPIQNPIIEQMKLYFQLFENELAARPRQERYRNPRT